MLNWIRKLIGNAPVCETCEVLKSELATVRYERQQLLDHILNPKIEKVETPILSNPQPLQSRVPWSVKRAQLEELDRIKALQIQRTEELERELLNDNKAASSVSSS